MTKGNYTLKPGDDSSFAVLCSLTVLIKEGKITVDDAVQFVESYDAVMAVLSNGETVDIKTEDWLWVEALKQ